MPYHASQMYARNLTAFLLHLVKDGKLQLNLEDEIVRETLVDARRRSGQPAGAGILLRCRRRLPQAELDIVEDGGMNEFDI